MLLHFWCFKANVVGLLSTKKGFILIGIVLYNHSSPVILANDANTFISTFQLPQELLLWKYKPFFMNFTFISQILLISLQMLVKLSVNNIIIYLSYNSNRYTQYKHVWKLFEKGSLHTVIVLYRLDRNKTLLKIFA